jgi:ABC-2 type transport system permease protein
LYVFWWKLHSNCVFSGLASVISEIYTFFLYDKFAGAYDYGTYILERSDDRVRSPIPLVSHSEAARRVYVEKRSIKVCRGGNMNRYISLYLHFLQFSFSKAMEFRLDFSFRILMDIIYYAMNIGLFKVLYVHTSLIGGWTEEQMMVFVGSYLVADAINMTIFSTNMWWLPYYINRGDLDYYLIRPVSPLFFLSLREFSANSFINLIIAMSFFIYTLVNYSAPWTWIELLGLLILLINGCLIYYCIQMLMILPVFWTQSSKGFIDLFYTMGIAMERPDKIFKGWLRVLFTVILPFGLIASFPVRIFLEGLNLETAAHLTGVTLVLWMLMLSIWRKGLKNYSSASS